VKICRPNLAEFSSASYQQELPTYSRFGALFDLT